MRPASPPPHPDHPTSRRGVPFLNRGSAKWTQYPPDVLPAWVAEMDFELAPAIKAALHDAIDRDDAGYVGTRHEGLTSAFVGFAARRLGWTVDPSQVRVATDVMVGVEELLLVLTSPGDGVIVTPPVYPPFFADVTHTGRTVVEVPLRRDGGLDVNGIADAFAAGARAFVLSNPHNPTGRVWTRDELTAVAAAAGGGPCDRGRRLGEHSHVRHLRRLPQPGGSGAPR